MKNIVLALTCLAVTVVGCESKPAVTESQEASVAVAAPVVSAAVVAESASPAVSAAPAVSATPVVVDAGVADAKVADAVSDR